MGKCCGCWASGEDNVLYKDVNGDLYCQKCAVKAADEAYKNMSYTEQYDIFVECFGHGDKEVFETFFDDFDDDEKLEAMGFEEIGG